MEILRQLGILVTLGYGLWYPSFTMYKRRAYQKVALIIDSLKYFVVIIGFYMFTTGLDFLLGSSSVYNLLKLIVVVYLGRGHYKGALMIYDSFVLPLALGTGDKRPFLMEFAMGSSNEDFATNTQHLFAHLISTFQSEYENIYAQIDLVE